MANLNYEDFYVHYSQAVQTGRLNNTTKEFKFPDKYQYYILNIQYNSMSTAQSGSMISITEDGDSGEEVSTQFMVKEIHHFGLWMNDSRDNIENKYNKMLFVVKGGATLEFEPQTNMEIYLRYAPVTLLQ